MESHGKAEKSQAKSVSKLGKPLSNAYRKNLPEEITGTPLTQTLAAMPI